MTKTYPIISLNGYLYAVDGKKGAGFYVVTYPNGNQAIERINSFTPSCTYELIVGSNHSSLTDVPKLPKIEEPTRIKEIFVVMNPKGGRGPMHHTYRCQAFEDLDDAKESMKGNEHLELVSEWIVTSSKEKKYSEEDMEKLLDWVTEHFDVWNKKGGWVDLEKRGYMSKDLVSEFVPSLKPIPIAVEVEMEQSKLYIEPQNLVMFRDNPVNKDTPYTTEAEDIWSPKVENGFVKVKNWIYE